MELHYSFLGYLIKYYTYCVIYIYIYIYIFVKRSNENEIVSKIWAKKQEKYFTNSFTRVIYVSSFP